MDKIKKYKNFEEKEFDVLKNGIRNWRKDAFKIFDNLQELIDDIKNENFQFDIGTSRSLRESYSRSLNCELHGDKYEIIGNNIDELLNNRKIYFRLRFYIESKYINTNQIINEELDVYLKIHSYIYTVLNRIKIDNKYNIALYTKESIGNMKVIELEFYEK